MTIHCRPMLPKDVRECVEILAVHPVVAPRYGDSIDQLRPAWLRLLGSEAFRSINKSELWGPSSGHLCAGFYSRAEDTSFFWIGPELARRVACGESPLLTDSQVCAANTLEGLNLVLWHVCDRLLRMRGARTSATQVSGAFVECHRGYLLKEMIALQATFVEEARLDR